MHFYVYYIMSTVLIVVAIFVNDPLLLIPASILMLAGEVSDFIASVDNASISIDDDSDDEFDENDLYY